MTEIVELSPNARRFAEEYLIDFKLSKAAERTGITPGYAALLLKDSRVDALIREGRRKTSERVQISIDNVLDDFRVLKTVDVADFFEEVEIMRDDLFGVPTPTGDSYMRLKPLGKWTDEMRFALKSIKHTKYGPEIVLHDKAATLEKLGKHLGMFVERVELTGKNGGPVQVVTPDMDPKQAAEAYAATLQQGRAA